MLNQRYNKLNSSFDNLQKYYKENNNELVNTILHKYCRMNRLPNLKPTQNYMKKLCHQNPLKGFSLFKILCG